MFFLDVQYLVDWFQVVVFLPFDPLPADGWAFAEVVQTKKPWKSWERSGGGHGAALSSHGVLEACGAGPWSVFMVKAEEQARMSREHAVA